MLVGVLIVAVGDHPSLWLVLSLVAVLEFVGGPAVTASQMLLTDIFPDRRLYARAFGLTTLAAQINQAIGLAIGGAVVGLIGDTKTLLLDLVTFLVGAVILMVVKPPKSVVKLEDVTALQPARRPGQGVAPDPLQPGPDLHAAAVAGQCARHRRTRGGGTALRRAAQPLAVLGRPADGGADPRGRGRAAVIGRLPAERQSALVMRLALLTPLPLLVTIFEPPLAVVWTAWFICGALQSYMLPVQAAFTLLVPTAMRGRVFGLGGCPVGRASRAPASSRPAGSPSTPPPPLRSASVRW